MTWALLAFSVSALGAVVTLSLLLHRQHNQTRAASDTAHEWRRQHDAKQGELELAAHELKVKDDEVVSLRKRLEIAERQRNEAYGRARDEFVERLRGAKLADASRLVSDLLSRPLGSGVLQEKPRSEDAVDGLVNPFPP